VVGFEALAHWRHPTRGLLPPSEFVPVAERTGAIRHLSRAVLAGAVRQLGAWRELDGQLSVAVNLTAVDLLDRELPAELERLLEEHEVDPRRLCVEITETTVMGDPERAQAVLERVVATGVRASVDDFGTGHSSLAYLKHLPVAEVKIDRSFVAALPGSEHDRLIVQAMIELGHKLGLVVVAEGVETEQVQEELRALGCDHAQGYLYARAVPADEAAALVSTWRAPPKRRRRRSGGGPATAAAEVAKPRRAATRARRRAA
jgi:EAL domain-containing protein (putative c-di-GMP-specific phosphodiesterase class I)